MLSGMAVLITVTLIKKCRWATSKDCKQCGPGLGSSTWDWSRSACFTQIRLHYGKLFSCYNRELDDKLCHVIKRILLSVASELLNLLSSMRKIGRMHGKASNFLFFFSKVRLAHLNCLMNLIILEHLGRISVYIYAYRQSYIIFITISWLVFVPVFVQHFVHLELPHYEMSFNNCITKNTPITIYWKFNP